MKHLITVAILLCGCLFFACKPNNATVPPSTIIPRDSMVAILIDIHLAEAMIQNIRRDRDTTRDATIQDYYQTIFKQHQISEEQFKEAFIYYSKDIEQFDAMYEDMQIRLSKMEEEAKVE